MINIFLNVTSKSGWIYQTLVISCTALLKWKQRKAASSRRLDSTAYTYADKKLKWDDTDLKGLKDLKVQLFWLKKKKKHFNQHIELSWLGNFKSIKSNTHLNTGND